MHFTEFLVAKTTLYIIVTVSDYLTHNWIQITIFLKTTGGIIFGFPNLGLCTIIMSNNKH